MNPTTQALQSRLDEIERELQGTLGLCVLPLTPDGPEVGHRAEEAFPAASTIKVFVLQTLLERVQAGGCSLDDEMVLGEEDKVTGSGVLKSLSATRSYTLLDLATLMIIVSDNTATNMLIERLGVEDINRVCTSHGWSGTRLAGKLQVSPGTSLSLTTPQDLARYFAGLWRGELLEPTFTQLAQDIYAKQQYTDALGRHLAYDAYSTETGVSSLRIASKSGSIRGVRNDAGVIQEEGLAYAIAVMTKGCPDERFYANNPGILAIADTSRVIHQYLRHGKGPDVAARS